MKKSGGSPLFARLPSDTDAGILTQGHLGRKGAGPPSVRPGAGRQRPIRPATRCPPGSARGRFCPNHRPAAPRGEIANAPGRASKRVVSSTGRIRRRPDRSAPIHPASELTGGMSRLGRHPSQIPFNAPSGPAIGSLFHAIRLALNPGGESGAGLRPAWGPHFPPALRVGPHSPASIPIGSLPITPLRYRRL